ncbi:SDR family NAD(P)-dependent oxidoreductase [Arthrobacter sp. NPDC080031]|uniref:SDR family NAD(P)-dependent oxidoreductase n=1 Tax=Arthrobacter sp. NPDC080031 TaxID=3155918 RepID=UPI00344F2A11
MTNTAVVTGAMSGLGQAIATRLKKDGLRVIRVDIQGGADITLDITDEHAVLNALGPLEGVGVLVNSAGVVGPDVPLIDTELEQWRRTFDVNVFGAVTAIRALAPGMVERGWGRIVNISSIAGKEGNPNLAAYSASKGALIALTKSVGKELAKTGVLVNAVAPAVIATPMNAATAPDILDHITRLIPMNRIGTPEEVARLVAWLASEQVSFSTGAVYDISGGRATY